MSILASILRPPGGAAAAPAPIIVDPSISRAFGTTGAASGGFSRFWFDIANKKVSQLHEQRPYIDDGVSIQKRFRSNRSLRGLYDGKDVRSGNNVSFSMKSTKRTFKPNVFKKRLYSAVLNEMILFHVTAKTLRSIDKMGGLDSYLLYSKHVVSDVDSNNRKPQQNKQSEGYRVQQRIIKQLQQNERILAQQLQQVP
jgi:large subunit ribosomal protein L28